MTVLEKLSDLWTSLRASRETDCLNRELRERVARATSRRIYAAAKKQHVNYAQNVAIQVQAEFGVPPASGLEEAAAASFDEVMEVLLDDPDVIMPVVGLADSQDWRLGMHPITCDVCGNYRTENQCVHLRAHSAAWTECSSVINT